MKSNKIPKISTVFNVLIVILASATIGNIIKYNFGSSLETVVLIGLFMTWAYLSYSAEEIKIQNAVRVREDEILNAWEEYVSELKDSIENESSNNNNEDKVKNIIDHLNIFLQHRVNEKERLNKSL